MVCLRTELSHGRAVVSISDTGAGIPAELLERIFAPFFTTTTSGLGMGLSISRTIIEAHGGRLWADTSVGSGATFSFTLPLNGAAVAQDSSAGR
jgi:signal transduction histidine kinase